MSKKTDMIIQVKWKATINGVEHEGTESEASWFLFDQRGTVLSYGPMKPIRECNDDYDEITPLIKIKDRFMSVAEIEGMIEDFIDLGGTIHFKDK